MKKNSRRALAAVLAVLLALTLTPVTAHAATVHQVDTGPALDTLLNGGSLADGDTIQLTAGISYLANYASQFNGKNITFDLNGYDLDIGGISVSSAGTVSVVNSNAGAGGVMTVNGYLEAYGGSKITADDDSVLKVHGYVRTSGAGSSATIYDVNEDTFFDAITVLDGGEVTVNGDVTVNSSSSVDGVSVGGSGGEVTVNGDITVSGAASSNGVYANSVSSGAQITVDGSIMVNGVFNTVGVLIQNSTDTTVSVTGDASAGYRGVYVNGGSGNNISVDGDVSASGDTLQSGVAGAAIGFGSGHSITVQGDVTASGDDPYGVLVSNAGSSWITVGGNISVTGDRAQGVSAANGSAVTVSRNVVADSGPASNGCGLIANGSSVEVGGDVSATGSGIGASYDGTVEVDGSVSANVSGPYWFTGVNVASGSHVTAGGISISGNASRIDAVGTYNSGSTVAVAGNVSAANSGGSAFGIYFNNSREVKVSGNVSVTAAGGSSSTGVSADSNDGWTFTAGSVSASGGSSNTGVIASGTGTATVDAIAADGYISINYSPVSIGTGTRNGDYYEYVSGSTAVRVKAWALTVVADPADGGDAGIGETSVTSGYFESGRQVSLVADDATGYDFDGWTSTDGSFDDDTSASAIFTMPATDATVTAEFEEADTYSVNISPGIIGGSITAVPTTAEKGDTINLTITPDPSHIYGENSLIYNDGTNHFLTVAGISAPFTSAFTMPDNDVTVSAEFEEITVPTIAAVTLPNGMETVSYTYTLSHNSNAPAEWSITSGSLPTGLTLSTSGAISGTPGGDTHGTYDFTVRVSNSGGSDTKDLTLVILPAEPVITTTSLPDATEGVEYEFQLEATCAGWVDWYVTDGSLPSGLDLSSDGVIYGTPTVEIETDTGYSVTISAFSWVYGSDEKVFTLTVYPAPENALTLQTDGHGSITSGIDGDYEEGAEISIAAAPDTGYAFSGWTSSDGGSFDDETSTSAIFTMPGNATTVTAIFVTGYDINIPELTGGSITASLAVAAEGAEVDLTITPDPGYVYTEDSLKYNDGEDNFLEVIDGTSSFTMPGSNVTVSAIFEEKPAIEVGDASGLSDALAELEDGDTIRLTADVTYPDPIYIAGIHVTIDTSDHTLNLYGSAYGDTALTVGWGGNLTLAGTGAMNINAYCGVEVYDDSVLSLSGAAELNIIEAYYGIRTYSSGSAIVTSVSAAGDDSCAVYANNGGMIIVTGDVSAEDYESCAVYADFGGTVTVTGDVTVSGDYSDAVYAYDENSAVTVTGGVSADGEGSHAVNALYDGTVIITGDIAVSGDYSAAVYSVDGSVTVTGDVSASGEGCQSLYAEDDGEINFTGSVTTSGDSSYAAYANGGMVSVDGDITITGDEYAIGAYAGNNGEVTVEGNIAASGENVNGAEAEGYAEAGGTVTVDGSITASGVESYGAYARGEDAFIEVSEDITVTDEGFNAVFAGNNAFVTVGGNVASPASAVSAYDSATVIVQGNATSMNQYSAGAYAFGGIIEIHGNVISLGSSGYGAVAVDYPFPDPTTGSAVTIDGTIIAEQYINFDDSTKTQADKTVPTTKPGYNTYTGGYSTVWVKMQPHAVTLQNDGNGTGSASPASAEQGQTITLSSTPNSGYRFKEWQAITPSGLSISENAFIMPDEPVTVKAVFEADAAPNPDGGGDNGGGSPSTPPAQGQNATVSGGGTVPITIDTATGNASLDLGTLAGNLSDGENTVVTVPSIPGANSFTANLPASSLSGSGQGSLTLNTGLGNLTIPGNMLSGMGLSGNAGITIGEGDTSGLSDEIIGAIGDRPIIQLTLTVNGQQTNWENSEAPVTLSISYTPTAEELANPEGIVIWYIDGSGNAVCVENGRYDPVSGTVTVDIKHFSDYAVVYNPVNFSDVPADVWYKKAVSFIAARDITTGTGGGNFSPNAKLTRGQFLVMLMKAYELAPDTNLINNFSDAGNTYYTGYLAAAKRLGITGGVGDNLFAPGREITRQEMFTLLYNALKEIGRLPEGTSGKPLSSFNDADGVASWAKEALTLLAQTGTVAGSGGKLAPTGTTTRAEMAQVLYNLLGK
ncbi:MAG TPA: S-layer homology domain-containing protein [Anaerovoracaceae bacterium]|nr:S-layer homology domain-containing protein [Anaerovoracaceae bacterium]